MINFSGRHFPKDIILMTIRWYVAYPLSYRNLEEIMLERNVSVDHSTLNRWVIRYAPELENIFRKQHKKAVNTSWGMDETYLKIKGQDVYLYRAVDKYGKTIDFLLSEKRDKKAAFSFFSKSINQHGLPDKITMDKSGANQAGLKLINFTLVLMSLTLGCWLNISMRQIKYLNNIIEQDHRAVKRLTKPMMGFKAFHSAKAILASIELHHMLKKGQHNNTDQQTVFEQFYALAA